MRIPKLRKLLVRYRAQITVFIAASILVMVLFNVDSRIISVLLAMLTGAMLVSNSI